MEEVSGLSPNRPPKTPLENDRRDNPGQTKIFEDSEGNSQVPSAPSWNEDTPLEDIVAQYTDIGTNFNNLAVNAAGNVGDRQVKLVGNDFGGTNPYMYNTYYEPSTSAFASEMRKEGTQAALEEGLDRAENEAKNNLAAAKKNYSDYLASQNNNNNGNEKNNKVHVSETDMSKMPEGATEAELQKFINATEGMSDEERRNAWVDYQIHNIQNKSADIDWNFQGNDWTRQQYSTEFRRNYYSDEQWNAMSKDEHQAFYDRPEIGNAWTEGYMKKYFYSVYGSDMGDKMTQAFDTLKTSTDIVIDAVKNADFSNLKNEDIYMPGVNINSDLSPKVEAMKKAIQESSELDEQQKKNAIDMISGEKWIGGSGAKNDYSEYGVERCLEELENKNAIRSIEKQGSFYKAVWKDKDGNKYDDNATGRLETVYQVLSLFSEGSSEYGLTFDSTDVRHPDHIGILSYKNYLDMSDLAQLNYGLHTGETLAQSANEHALSAALSGAYGFDLKSANDLANLKANDPETFKYLNDHSAFIMSGGAGAFEVVEDKDKKYFLNGKYWSASDEDSPISVGDLVFHSIDGTVDADGKYTDSDLESFVSLYQDIRNGKKDANDDNLKALEEYYKAYQNRLVRSFFLAQNKGTSVDENMYAVMLALDGKGSDKLQFVNPSNPDEKMSLSAISSWFDSMSDDGKYMTYTALVNKAAESNGFLTFYDESTGQYYQQNLKTNGVDTVGRYNENINNENDKEMNGARQIDKLSPTQALAILFYIDNEMQKGNIAKGFLDNDENNAASATVNGVLENAKGAVEAIIATGEMGLGALGALFGAVDEDGTNELERRGYAWWEDMTTLNEEDDWASGNNDSFFNPYTESVRDRQRANLNHMVDTTFNLHYFDADNSINEEGQLVDKDGNPVSLDNNHFNHEDRVKAVTVQAGNMAGAIIEFALELYTGQLIAKGFSVAGKGLGWVGSKGASLISKTSAGAKAVEAAKHAVSGVARVLTTPVTFRAIGSAVKAAQAEKFLSDIAFNYGDDIAEGIVDGTISSFDDIARIAVSNADNVAAKTAETVAEATAKEVAKESAERTVASGVKEAVEAAKGTADNVAANAAETGAKAATKAASAADTVVGTENGVRYVLLTGKGGAVVKLTETGAKGIISAGQTAARAIKVDYAIRYGLDSVIKNTDDVGRGLAKRMSDKVLKVLETRHPFFDGTNAAFRSLVEDTFEKGAVRAAMNARIAAVSGVDAAKIASMSDEVASALYGVVDALGRTGGDVESIALKSLNRYQKNLAKDIILNKVDFEKAVTKIADLSESAVRSGTRLSVDDVYKIIATSAGVEPGELLKSLRFSEFAKDRIKDWTRDIAQNYWSPELDENFESQYVDWEEYITNPGNILLSAVFDAGTTMLGKGINSIRLHATNKAIDDILGNGVDMSTPNKIDASKMRKDLMKLDRLRVKAEKLNNKIIDGKVSFDKVHSTADKADKAIKEHVKNLIGDVDFESQCERISDINAAANAQAKAALASGTLKGKRQYRRILADASELNRIIIRGNDKLRVFVEANNALQQNSITRYLDIESKAKTIHRITPEKWANAIRKTYADLSTIDFAKTFGEIDESPSAYKGFTINAKDPKNTKIILEKGQRLFYDTLYDNIVASMGDYLTTTEKRQLKAELNSICERMIEGGYRTIDAGHKVRWNYFPTQALTWESEPGTSSAVRALWGWDYKAGVHTSQAGEIANPMLARDEWDIYKILKDHEDGVETFQRRKGDASIERETRESGRAADEYKEVPYNWTGFDPAYACNAYLNSLDSAEFISPILDPINGVIVTNSAAADAIVSMTGRISNSHIAELTKKYRAIADEKIAKKSGISEARRKKLLEDFSSRENLNTAVKNDLNGNVAKREALIKKETAEIRQKLEKSPLVKNLANIYAQNSADTKGETFNAYALRKHQQNFLELGQDIKAVRNMHTKSGKLKKKYLGEDGKPLAKFLDSQGNIVPEGNVSATYSNDSATQYRSFVNKLAAQKVLKDEIFAPDSSYTIKFEDGVEINSCAFQQTLYNVLVTKQLLDLGVDMDLSKYKNVKAGTASATKPTVEATVGKRLQPIVLDDDGARVALTKGARGILDKLYGKYNKFSKSYEVDGKLDTILQTAINKTFDQVEAEGGQINTYDFVKRVDDNLPDFVKSDKTDSAAVKNLYGVLEHLRTYETSGGSIDSLYTDLVAAYKAEKSQEKRKILKSAAETIGMLYDYDARTTGRGALSESDIEAPGKGEEDFDDRYDDDLSDQGGVNGVVGQNTGEIDIDEEDRKLFPSTAETVGLKNENTPTSVGIGNTTAQETSLSSDSDSGTFEASTAGHKEFSALNAKFAPGTKIMGIDIGGRTIEDVYQNTLKGSGKNQAPAADSVLGKATADAEKKAGKALTKAEKEAISQRYYDRLWDIWGEQNPDLKAQIENLPAGTKITDQFAKTGVSQANSLQRWVKPAQANTGSRVKVISGGQTGVDTIGLEVGKELGLETGGTAAPGFYRLPGEDQYTAKDMAAFGLKEIDPKLQAEMAKTRRQVYLPRTRQNVINSDGTVYFSSSKNSAGYAATKRFADASGKPFILNPTASQLREWMTANNIKTLNVAGSRGSHIDNNFRKHVKDVLSSALKDPIDTPANAAAETASERIKSLKDSLDYLHGKANSDYRQRTDYRAMRRKAYDDVSKQFNNIADAMEKKVAGDKSDKVVIKDILKHKDVDFFPSPEEIYESLHRNKAVLSQSTIDKIEAYRKVYRRYEKNGSSSKDRNTVLSILRGSSETGKSRKGLFTIINEDAAKHAQSNRVKQGTGIYRGSDFLSGANDSQYLAFINGNHERTWNKSAGAYTEFYPDGTRKNFYNNTADKLEARNAIKAGRDGFGNIIFMEPDKLIDYAERNNLNLDAKDKNGNSLRSVIEKYRELYNANKDVILDSNKRYSVSDTNTNSQEALIAFLSSLEGNTSSSYDRVDPKWKNAEPYKYHSEGSLYEKNAEGEYKYPRGKKNVEAAEKELARSGASIRDSYQDLYPETDVETTYDFTGYEREIDEVYDAIKKNSSNVPEDPEELKEYNSPEKRNERDKYYEPVRKAADKLNKKIAKAKAEADELSNFVSANTTDEMRSIQKKIDDFKAEYKKNGYQKYNKPLEKTDEYIKLNKQLENATPDHVKEAEKEIDRIYSATNKEVRKFSEYAKGFDKYGPTVEQTKTAAEAASKVSAIDRKYSTENVDRFSKDSIIPDYAEEESARMLRNPAIGSYRNTTYIDYMNATKRTDITSESAKLTKVFYGDDNSVGYFDSIKKHRAENTKDVANIAKEFNEKITDKITALKGIDDATDKQLVTILKSAKEEAKNIKDESVRAYITKRLDEEIEFVEAEVKKTNKSRDELVSKMLERDPEYQAYKQNKAQYKAENNDTSKLSVQVPSTANPVFVKGSFTPDGHLTLQQILDAQNEIKLSSKKNGKNNLKSYSQTRKVLKAMRKDYKNGYNGSTLITSGAASQQRGWIINLYCRIYDASGLGKLPRKPTFEEISEGKMIADITDKNGQKKTITVKLPIKLSEIYVDPKIASLGAHYWGEGKSTSVRALAKTADIVTKFNKSVQDMQLAGGYAQYNALTLRNAVTMMWQDPIGGTRALFSNFYHARSNDSVVKFYLDNHEKLLKMAMDSGDYSAINGFVNVINMRDEIGGGGMIQDFGHQIAEIPNVFKEKGLIAMFGDTAKNMYDAIFNNPTFVRWTTIAQADMNLRNYDKATRYVNRICTMYDITDEDFAKMEGGMRTKDRYIATIAQLRSDKYWKPHAFVLAGNNVEKYLNKKDAFEMKRTTESLRGMPQKKTLRQVLSDFFFAIGYKLQMNAHPAEGIATIFTALPNNVRAVAGLSSKRSFNVASSRFIGRGNRNQVLTMIGICALAHAWNTYIGAPSAWEELWSDHGDKDRKTYGLAKTLLTFQDLGKFWIPADESGTRFYAYDPFSSIFTLQNSVYKGLNKALFPQTETFNPQRLGFQEPGSIGARIQGATDEIIGANLLSPYKALYEVLNNNTYYGNNIWERSHLPDGSQNPNYNPLRNMMASVAHILNLEEAWLGDTTNKWVKGLDIDAKTWKDGVPIDPESIGPDVGDKGDPTNARIGTVAGSGVLQHEFVTAAKKAAKGEYFEALNEAMELPFKSRDFEARARTDLNTEVMLSLRFAKQKYDKACEGASVEAKNEAYHEFAETAVKIVEDWSKRNAFVLGKKHELDATATKILVSFLSDEYDDASGKIQNRYDKMKQELKMAAGEEFLFSKEAMEAAIADGMDDTVAAEKHNAHLRALREAYIKEYNARQTLIEAGYDPGNFETTQYISDDLSGKSATFDKKTYEQLKAKFEQPVGEFKNFTEMKAYYETLIENASTTKQKAKLANEYNKYVTDIIAPYVGNGFSAQAFNDIYWDGENLANSLGKYIIIPADKYYKGKTPNANYLKDQLGIGWRDNHNLPSDADVKEQINKVNKALSKGNISSASSLVDNILVQLRKGTLHASPEDYEKLIRMRALLSSRSR